MEPGEPQPIEEQPDPAVPMVDGFGTPVLIGGGVALALVLTVVVGYAVRGRPRPSVTAPPPVPVQEAAEQDSDPAPSALAVEAPQVAVEPAGIVGRMRAAMSRSRSALQSGLERLLGRPMDEAAYEELEEVLILADVGVHTCERLLNAVRAANPSGDPEGHPVRDTLKGEMTAILTNVHAQLRPAEGAPFVVLVVGVNGSGKTTTIGKLAHRFRAQGKRVVLAAADTYRAAAAEQLEVWAQRTDADFVRLDEGADPGAVVYKAMDKARAEGHDVVIVDTAGRLQTARPLMEQLSKIRRVIAKSSPDGPHETLLVLDGTTGQNGMSQARLFNEATPITGVVVTKLDGTAKGGMVLAIAAELELPVKLVGLGEQAEDLRDFDPAAFVDALL